MGPCGKAAAGHEESNHSSDCSYFTTHLSESGLIWSAGFCWINIIHHFEYETANSTYDWMANKARRTLEDVLDVRARDRRPKLPPPVAQSGRAGAGVEREAEARPATSGISGGRGAGRRGRRLCANAGVAS
jgi:hypothetical protein